MPEGLEGTNEGEIFIGVSAGLRDITAQAKGLAAAISLVDMKLIAAMKSAQGLIAALQFGRLGAAQGLLPLLPSEGRGLIPYQRGELMPYATGMMLPYKQQPAGLIPYAGAAGPPSIPPGGTPPSGWFKEPEFGPEDWDKYYQSVGKGTGIFASLRDVASRAFGTITNFAKQAGAGISEFSAQLGRTLGIATRWYFAYRIIRGTLGGIAQGFEEVKALEIEEIFTDFTFAGEESANVLQKIMPLSKKWGIGVIETYRAMLQFGRALGDMYKIGLPEALALTDVAMEVTVASGQNLNESISNMVGYVRMLGVESVKDIKHFMEILYAAAYRTNEALTLSGQSVKGGALAMDTLTDAMQRMLPSMKNFGMSWEQLAAIASIFITNLDEAGQGIGAYSAKLFAAIKDNQNLRDVYQDVGVELTRHKDQLIPALVEGYLKMTSAQRDLAEAATRVGIGQHIVSTFWESLPQIMSRANDVKKKSNLLDDTAVKMMSTLQKKQDQLRVSMQALNLQVIKTGLPAFKSFTEFLNKTAQAIEWTGKSLGITAGQIKEGIPLALKSIWYAWSGQEDKFNQMQEQLKYLGRAVDEELGSAYEEVFGMNEELIKQYMDMELKMQQMFQAMKQGITPDEVLILENVKKVANEYSMRLKVAIGDLGLFANQQEINKVKIKLLNEELERLTELMEKLPSALAKLEVAAQIAEIRLEIEKISTEYSNIVEMAGRLADVTYEGKRTNEEMLQHTKQLSKQFEDITVRGLKGLIQGTATWKDMLAEIGDVVLEELLRKLVRVFLGGEAPGGGILGGIAGILGSIFGIPVPTTQHIGGVVQPRFQVGGEVPILAEPGEFIVRRTESQKHRGLLEDINQGRYDEEEKKSVNYYIQAADAASFIELCTRYPDGIHIVVQEAIHRNKGLGQLIRRGA